MSGVAVHVKNRTRGPYSGRAYQSVPSCSPAVRCASIDCLITIRIGSSDRFPASNWIESKGHAYGGKRSPRIDMLTWEEGLLCVAAHEARHIWQFRNGRRVSEIDCERFALRRLEEWRKACVGEY